MIKILVPVDFSDTSFHALYYAIDLFKPSSLELTLLHAYASSMAVTIKNIDKVIREDSKRSMYKLIQKIKKDYPELDLNPKIVKDHAVSAIASLGDSGKFDFIVMGTQGASGLKEVFLGSVAGGVIARSSVPVIVVPKGHSFRPLDQVVVALSTTPVSDPKVADPLRKIARMHKSKVRALHIDDDDHQCIQKVVAAIMDLNPVVDHVPGTGNTSKDLNDYVLTHSCGMLCLIREKKGFFERLFTESVTLKQTFHSLIPLLILHDPA